MICEGMPNHVCLPELWTGNWLTGEVDINAEAPGDCEVDDQLVDRGASFGWQRAI